MILWGSAYPKPPLIGGSAYPEPYEFTELEKEQIIEYMKGMESDAQYTNKQTEEEDSEDSTTTTED